mgnify:CR=1 FL=1|jgi:chemotaxis protein MotB
MSSLEKAPVIIKRKKVIAGGGHHGGAWKVAYADFVTAMMAFFMLMWLLNATSAEQRKGLADYFSPTIPIHRLSGGGAGMFGGDDIFSQQNLTESGSGSNGEEVGVADLLTREEQEVQSAEIAQVAALREVEETLLGRGGESTISEEALRHIVTRLTDEGLVIELFDVPDAALFVGQTDTPSRVTQEIVGMLARILQAVDNPIAVQGHLASQAVIVRDNPVWDLSISRVARMRMMLEVESFDPYRIIRVTGFADRSPIVTDSTAVRNNRIEIVVLRSDQ